MITKFEIRGVHYEIDDNLRKYITKKIGGMDRYLSRHDRASAHAEVMLKESKNKNKVNCTCEVTLYIPRETINLSESALNMFAAVDIVEAKLKQQLKKHKDLHENGKRHRHIFGRLRRRLAGAA